MKGLLRKEFAIIGGGATFVTLVIFMVFVLVMQQPHPEHNTDSAPVFVPLVLACFTGFHPFISHSAEGRWRQYVKTLPYSRKQIVDAKYLFACLAAGCMLIFEVLLLFLLNAPHIAAMTALAASVMLLIPALLLPFIFLEYRRGWQTGTLLLFLSVCLLTTAAGFVLPIMYSIGTRQSSIEPESQLLLYSPYYLLAAAVLLFPLSWLLSRRIFCRRKKRRA